MPLISADSQGYANMISMDDVDRWSRLLDVRQTLFVLDACFSGLAGVQRKGPLNDKTLAGLSQYGHHLITAGTANEESVASVKLWGGSLFTDAFLRGASGRADASTPEYPADGVVSLKELLEYIRHRIDFESQKNRIRMSPQISDLDADNAGEFFFLARIPPIVGDRQAEEPVAAMALTKGTTPGAAPTPPPEISKPNMLSKPHVYLVFFNHLEYTLTPEAIKILRDVQDSLFYFLIDSINIPNILVVGYDDLSGSRQDSQLISERRAMSVANQLIRQGVPRELIYVAALGQEDPLILPSGEGVPQNRRVKIVIDPTPKDISDAGARLYAANCISRHRLFVQRIGEAHVSDSSTALRAFGRWR